MRNVYDVLYVRPKLHKKLKRPQEALAQAIVASGRMRLDADNESNFTRLLMPKERVNLTFTRREITEPALQKSARERLMRVLLERHPEKEATALTDQYLDIVTTNLKKKMPVTPKVELMMARALVSCNALPVIRLLHLEGAEIYISYGQTVSDVMDIATWQEIGESNGLQSFGQGQNAVYVSCGGHPFLSDDERTYHSDGFPALARCMVIAAQETGHNGDMIRDERGNWVGRYSAVDWGRAPSARAGKGRRMDLRHTEHLYNLCVNMGLNLIVEWERHLAFYHENKLRNWRFRWAWFKSRAAWLVLTIILRMRGTSGLAKLQKDRYPATLMRRFFYDMMFNLAPQADVYKRADPLAEEAIVCIEAVARVPQQAVKWGHAAVQCCLPSLYTLYYGTIVPGCEKAANRLSPQPR